MTQTFLVWATRDYVAIHQIVDMGGEAGLGEVNELRLELTAFKLPARMTEC